MGGVAGAQRVVITVVDMGPPDMAADTLDLVHTPNVADRSNVADRPNMAHRQHVADRPNMAHRQHVADRPTHMAHRQHMVAPRMLNTAVAADTRNTNPNKNVSPEESPSG